MESPRPRERSPNGSRRSCIGNVACRSIWASRLFQKVPALDHEPTYEEPHARNASPRRGCAYRGLMNELVAVPGAPFPILEVGWSTLMMRHILAPRLKSRGSNIAG